MAQGPLSFPRQQKFKGTVLRGQGCHSLLPSFSYPSAQWWKCKTKQKNTQKNVLQTRDLAALRAWPGFVALLRGWVRRKASCDSLAGAKGGEQRRDVLDIVCPPRLVWVGFQVTVRYFQTTHSAFHLRIVYYFSTDNTCAVLF